MLILALLLVLPTLLIGWIYVYAESPLGAALGTWLMLTVIGLTSTCVSFFLYVGVGHGGPAPAALPLFVGFATLSLPMVGAIRMKRSKERRGSDTEELAVAAPASDEPAHDDGTAGERVTSGDEVE